MVKLTLGFSGGLELLFNNETEVKVDVPSSGDGREQGGDEAAAGLVPDKLITGRQELFMKGESVRPGILVIVNDCDWELLGELEMDVQDGDHVVFISTLHGG